MYVRIPPSRPPTGVRSVWSPGRSVDSAGHVTWGGVVGVLPPVPAVFCVGAAPAPPAVWATEPASPVACADEPAVIAGPVGAAVPPVAPAGFVAVDPPVALAAEPAVLGELGLVAPTLPADPLAGVPPAGEPVCAPPFDAGDVGSPLPPAEEPPHAAQARTRALVIQRNLSPILCSMLSLSIATSTELKHHGASLCR